MTHDQQRAIAALQAWVETLAPNESNFFALKGYAGVGKTWLTIEFLSWLLEAHPRLRVVVTAPTNKAVDVLREKAKAQAPDLLDKVSFRTLDSFLGFRVKRNDDWQMERSRRDTNDGDAPDLVLVDESSMVKEEYHSELRHRRCAVLYVGDPAQLQPVGEATSPAFSVPDHVVMTEVVRQAAGNPIIDMATMMRSYIDAGRNDFTLMDLAQYATPQDRRVSVITRSAVYDWAQSALGAGMDCRILAFTNAAVAEHNHAMHERCYPNTPVFGVGELALVNEAFEYDDEVLLTNGQLLRVVRCEQVAPIEGVDVYEVEAQELANSLHIDGEAVQKVLTLYVARRPSHAIEVHRELTDEIYRTLAERRKARPGSAEERQLMDKLNDLYARRRPLNKLAPLRHAYACTVHKSQGSTYDVAIVDFADVYRSQEMRARLLYVAATRPSKFLALARKA